MKRFLINFSSQVIKSKYVKYADCNTLHRAMSLVTAPTVWQYFKRYKMNILLRSLIVNKRKESRCYRFVVAQTCFTFESGSLLNSRESGPLIIAFDELAHHYCSCPYSVPFAGKWYMYNLLPDYLFIE